MASLQDVSTALNNIAQQLGKFIASTGLAVIVPITGGGTGATTAAAARTNLGLGAAATDNVVSVAHGGTGNSSAGATAANAIGALAEANNLSDVASAATARSNLGIVSGATTTGHLATFVDGTKVLQDGGLAGPYATAVLGQLPGTATNDNAAAGDIGEYISQNIVVGSAVTLTTTLTAYTIASLALTPGDWDVSGQIHFTPAGITGTSWFTGICGTAATIPTLADAVDATHGPAAFSQNLAGTIEAEVLPTGVGRVSINTNTVIYLSAEMVFTGTAPTAYGFIRARRMR